MNLKSLVLATALLPLLAACGGGSGGSSETSEKDVAKPNPPSTPTPTEEKPAEGLKYIEDSNSSLTINQMDILSTTDQQSILKTSSSNPLNVYPGEDGGFTFSWVITSKVALFSKSFLVLRHEGQDVAVFSLLANPINESLKASARCTYDNHHILACSKPATPASYASEKETDMTTLFQQLPAIYEVQSEVCSAAGGCDRVHLGYLRFN